MGGWDEPFMGKELGFGVLARSVEWVRRDEGG